MTQELPGKRPSMTHLYWNLAIRDNEVQGPFFQMYNK